MEIQMHARPLYSRTTDTDLHATFVFLINVVRDEWREQFGFTKRR
jgi:hypothetical protein